MNSVCPFESPHLTDQLDPNTIKVNVAFWRRKHGLKSTDKFQNNPRILKLSGKKIVIAIDQQLGKEVV